MVLVFIFLSTTVLGEVQKNRKIETAVYADDAITIVIKAQPAIIMATSVAPQNEEKESKKGNTQGLISAVNATSQIPIEGARFRVIKISIKEKKNYFNFERGPLKKVLKKPINRDCPA